MEMATAMEKIKIKEKVKRNNNIKHTKNRLVIKLDGFFMQFRKIQLFNSQPLPCF